jgi:hypothetical protein
MAVDDDPGAPISYLVLEKGTPVYADGGVAVGRVKRVLAVEDEDIFDGIVVHTHDGDRFADADQIGPIHEHAVALNLTAEQCRALPEPSANPAVMHDDAAEGPETSLEKLEDMARTAWDKLTGKY